MAMARDRHSLINTRTRLIEAALHCFASCGYSGVGIRKIASEAKVNPALIHYHFGSKADLYRAVLQHALAIKRGRISQAVKQMEVGSGVPREAVAERLYDFIRGVLGVALHSDSDSASDDAIATLLSRELEAPSPQFMALLAGFAKPVVGYLDQAIGTLRPDLEEGERFAMVLAIACQLLYIRHTQDSLCLLGAVPARPGDSETLIQRLSGYSLKGLGMGESLSCFEGGGLRKLPRTVIPVAH